MIFMKNNHTRASLISLLCDCILAVMKFIVGITAHSHALVSDGVHSCADVFSSIIVLVGISANHSKIEKIRNSAPVIEKRSLIFLSAILFSTGIAIGINGIVSTFSLESSIAVPELPALIVTLIALGIKESLFFYNLSVAKKTGSELLKANAWHHQSDGLSCIGSFIGILGARLGYPVFDPIASVAISLLIIKVGVKIFITTIKEP